jgi:Ca2+/Na+ antiporter
MTLRVQHSWQQVDIFIFFVYKYRVSNKMTGASSPEMFTSFIALFINHSAIGVGTVVGSEIFNHMIICAGSVMYSTTGVLQLDKRIVSRDVMAYFTSLIVLIWALKGDYILLWE